jgi:hypothetical protein
MNIYADNLPYTYFLMWKSSKLKYYGCQYGKKANPQNILSGTYRTSSKYVKQYWNDFGAPDIIVIHRTFQSSKECREFEQLYLKRVRAPYKEDWLNKTDNKAIVTENYNPESWQKSHASRARHRQEDPEFNKLMNDRFVKMMHSESATAKRKETFIKTQHSKGANNPRYGVTVGEDTRKKMSIKRKSQYEFNVLRSKDLNKTNKVCEHCGKSGLNAGNYKRWHGSKCPKKPTCV